MTDRTTQLRRRGPAREAPTAVDHRSMRLLELALAFTAIGASILLAVARS